MTLVTVGLLSFCLCGIITVLANKLKLGLDAPTNESYSPQKFHTKSAPRLGGIAIYFSLFVGILFVPQNTLMLLLITALPAFFGGISEDLTARVTPTIRLFLTFIAAGIAWFIIDAQLHRVGVYLFDDLLDDWWWLSLLFTMFAVGGVAHSINIIDGFNGLMSGVSMLAASFFAIIAYQLGDSLVLQMCLLLLFAIFGFFLWNFPWGKIFMGDGGAYTIGFLLAEIAVLLVSRHAQITPWSGFLIMAYPIVETLFSMYRKKVLRNMSPGQPDGLHLHMLVYKRIVLPKIRQNDQNKRRAHVHTSIILYLLALLPMIFTLFTYTSSALTLLGLFLFMVTYTGLYYRLLLPMIGKKTSHNSK